MQIKVFMVFRIENTCSVKLLEYIMYHSLPFLLHFPDLKIHLSCNSNTHGYSVIYFMLPQIISIFVSSLYLRYLFFYLKFIICGNLETWNTPSKTFHVWQEQDPKSWNSIKKIPLHVHIFESVLFQNFHHLILLF